MAWADLPGITADCAIRKTWTARGKPEIWRIWGTWYRMDRKYKTAQIEGTAKTAAAGDAGGGRIKPFRHCRKRRCVPEEGAIPS